MEVLVCDGWSIYFHPEFAEQWNKQVDLVTKLKSKLDREEFVKHPDAKLLVAMRQCIKEKIPLNPHAKYFMLKKGLKKYRRVKKMGLPERYRLFFRASSVAGKKVIVILWLGYPRREGDKNDCYEKFKQKLTNQIFSDNVTDLVAECVEPVKTF